MILFRPSILLIDEPDAHLHPDRQELLIRTIEDAAVEFSTQIILTTHSPHVVRTASPEVRLAWLTDGGVAQDERKIREQMGWGLLDRTSLIITEDANTPILQSILAQWPDIDRRTAVWPVFGVENLPTAEGARALRKLLGIERLVVHRDADFLLPRERAFLVDPYDQDGCRLWITEGSDIEGYLCSADRIAKLTEETVQQANVFLEACIAKTFVAKTFRAKRSQINKKEAFYPGGAGTPTIDDAKNELSAHPAGTVPGKQLLGALKAALHESHGLEAKTVMALDGSIEVAGYLKALLA